MSTTAAATPAPTPFANSEPNHRWAFVRAGGVDQVHLRNGADLAALGALDPKLWVALAAPVTGLELDARTLALLDADSDGRLRLSDVVEASRWASALLKSPDALLRGQTALPLSAIREDAADGPALLASARAALRALGKADATELSVAEATAALKAFEKLPLNGDGVIPPEAVTDPELRAVLVEAMEAIGHETDRSGQRGLTAGLLESFHAELVAYDAWHKKGESGAAAVLPLGKDTAAAFEAFARVREKLDDYFARCRLGAFDPRAVPHLNRDEKEYAALAPRLLSLDTAEVAALPLSPIQAGKPLSLVSGVNPAWVDALARFHDTCVVPILGARQELSETELRALSAKLSAHEAWLKEKAGAKVEKLGLARVRLLLEQRRCAQLAQLIEEDKAKEPELKGLIELEKLVRLHRDLGVLLRNFVSFSDFYGRAGRAAFVVGTLFIDRRACELCVRVEDLAKHQLMAPLARTYLLYCECVRKATGEKMTIAAAVTAGDADNLMVGRNGLFFDRQNREWDATVVKVFDSPISVRQAFWAPYKKAMRFVAEQMAKRVAAADAAASQKLITAAVTTEKAADTGKPPPEKPKFDVGTVAALGVAVGGITAALGALLGAFFGLGYWMPVGLVGLMLLISGPSMLIAAFKLRERNLGPLLDANGWAVNAFCRINIPLGASLTRVGVLPKGATRNLVDPFSEKKRPWALYATLVLLVALAAVWATGKLDRFLPEKARKATVFAPRTASPSDASGPP